MANPNEISATSEFAHESSFLAELYEKTQPLHFHSENGNQCVCIKLGNCSPTFVRNLEDFIAENPDHFRLVARGVDYYLEILGRESFAAAYQKSFLKH